jgi:hypothetical protein
MRLVVIILGLSFLKSFEALGQGNSTGNNEALVVFDPLFWKDELKLTPGQSTTIQNINMEYYEGIYQAVDENEGNIKALQSITADLLHKRSEKIWNTFQPKQKRKWNKLSAFYSEDDGRTSSTSFLSLEKAKILAKGR